MDVKQLTFKRCSIHRSDFLNFPEIVLTQPSHASIFKCYSERVSTRNHRQHRGLYLL